MRCVSPSREVAQTYDSTRSLSFSSSVTHVPRHLHHRTHTVTHNTNFHTNKYVLRRNNASRLTSAVLVRRSHLTRLLACERARAVVFLVSRTVESLSGVRGSGLGTFSGATTRALAASLIFPSVFRRNSGSAHFDLTLSLIRFLCSSDLGIIFAMRSWNERKRSGLCSFGKREGAGGRGGGLPLFEPYDSSILVLVLLEIERT